MESSTSALSFGLVDGRPVFADLVDDSYFMLGPDEEPGFLEQLNRKGADGIEGPLVLPPPESSALSHITELPRPRLGEILAVARLLILVSIELRREPISKILSGVRLRRNSGVEEGDPIEAARRFASARRLVPIRFNCLRDSLALMHWLASRRANAVLVLGVKLDPFAAHCWVQSKTCLLNDHAERIERFTPVRVVRCTPDMP
jgi:hypothetical protein